MQSVLSITILHHLHFPLTNESTYQMPHETMEITRGNMGLGGREIITEVHIKFHMKRNYD